MLDPKTLWQIERDASKKYGGGLYDSVQIPAYIAGATAYATKSAEREKILVEALEKIKNNFDHEDYGDKNENCPVCIATFALEKLKAL